MAETRGILWNMWQIPRVPSVFACHKVKLQIEIDVSSAETKGRLSESMIKG